MRISAGWLMMSWLVACSSSPPPEPPAPVATVAPPASAMPSAEAPKPAFKPMQARIPISAQDVRWGDDEAPVTAVLFGAVTDRSSEIVLERLNNVQQAVGARTLRIVWKSQKGAGNSFESKIAQALVGVQATSGGDAAARFLKAARPRTAELASAQPVMDMAREAGVTDLASYEKRLVANEFEAKVKQDHEESERLGLAQGPTLFVNGYRLAGLVKTAALRAVVDDEVAAVTKLRAEGKSASDAYAQRTQQNAASGQDFPLTMPRLASGDLRRIDLGNAPTLGSPKALVTLVMFGGYQDPFSRRAWETIEKLRKKYKNDLRIVWKDAPLAFHRAAMVLGAMPHEARVKGGDAAYWRMHEKLMARAFWDKNSKELIKPEIPPATYDTIARQIGFQGSWKDALDKHQKELEAGAAEWQSSGSNGTPSFFINGRHLSGAQPQNKFEEAIEQEMARARDKVKSGVKPEELYGSLMSEIKRVDEE